MRICQIIAILLVSSTNMFAQKCPPSKDPNLHIVQSGETFYSISRKYKLSVNELTRLNGMKTTDILYVCKKLVVKRKGTTKPSQPKTDGNPPKNYNNYTKQQGKYHYVQPGETLANIARLYGYTTERFKEFNNLASYEGVRVGQALLNSDCACANEGLTATEITNEAEDRFENDNATEDTDGQASGIGKYPFMRGDELKMIEEINLVRSNPKGYIPYIEAYIEEVKKNRRLSDNTSIAAYELIDQLSRTSPLSVLKPRECLHKAAELHGEDRKKAGSNDHAGTNGSWPWDRIRNACAGIIDGNENLIGGTYNIRLAVVLLLVDAGFPSRGHRSTLLNPKWKYIACYKAGTIGNMPNSWVQNFAY